MQINHLRQQNGRESDLDEFAKIILIKFIEKDK